MIFTKEQINEAYKKLPPEVQDLIMSNETTELIANYLKETDLTPEQSISADSEILYAMFGLQTLTDTIGNIAKLVNKNANDFSKLKTNLENNIFSKIQGNEKVLISESNKNKILEISKKYSLNENQTDELISIVAPIIVENKKPETFGASLETELGISELLTEQIMKDLDERVFQYATEFIEKQNGTNANSNVSKVEIKTPFDVLGKQKDEVEVPPVILPMVESDEQRRKVVEQNRIANTERPAADIAGALRASIGNSVPQSTRPIAQVPENLPGIAVDVVSKTPLDMQNQMSKGVLDTTTQDGVFIGSEFIQKPIAVPRFNAVSTPENPENKTVDALSAKINNEQQPQSIIDTKLNSVTSASAPAPKPEVQNPPHYGSDPYREPLE